MEFSFTVSDVAQCVEREIQGIRPTRAPAWARENPEKFRAMVASDLAGMAICRTAEPDRAPRQPDPFGI